MSYGEIWQTLSKIDVSKYIEKKHNLSYLSWAWAWGVLMDKYPDATYEFQPSETHADESVTVHCTVKIGECSRSMWLAVMDYKNQAVKRPDAVTINKNKMRCLVKCIAMFGLGHYIYAGEDLPEQDEPQKPQPDSDTGAVKLSDDEYKALVLKYADSIHAIQNGIEKYYVALGSDYDAANGFLSLAAEAWFTLPKEAVMGLWRAPSKGGCFTTKQVATIKSAEFRKAYYGETQ